MSSILKVDQLQDSGGNEIITSNGSGTITVNNQTFKNGITMADQWRLTTTTNQGTNADVTTNWERVDTDGYGSLGTGLTESSGIFSFPTTGIYLINYVARMAVNTNDLSANFILYTTLDNSTYGIAGYATNGNPDASNSVTCTASNHQLFDVTDITTHKFKFATGSFATATSLSGNTGDTRTGFAVIRLGDT